MIKCCKSVQADENGDTGWLRLRPFLVDGAVAVGTEVTIAKPVAKWRLPIDGYQAGTGRLVCVNHAGRSAGKRQANQARL